MDSSVPFFYIPTSTKKDAQLESCKLSFVWSKMSPRGGISDSSERLLQTGSWGRSIYKISVKGRVQCNQALTLQEVFYESGGSGVIMKGFPVFLEKEMQRLELWNQFLKISNYLKTCSIRFPGGQRASLHPEIPQEGLKVSSCSSARFNLHRKWKWSRSALYDSLRPHRL